MPGLEISQISDQTPEDQTWDGDKAATLAAALKENGPLDMDLQHRDFKLAQGRPEAVNARTELENLVLRKNKVQEELQGLDDSSDAAAQLRSELEDINERINEKQQKIDTLMSEHEVATMDTVHANADQFLTGGDQPFAAANSPEAIYDSNPDVFAAMPTREFMDIVHESRRISGDVEAWTNRAADAAQYAADLETFEQQPSPQLPDSSFIIEYVNRFKETTDGLQDKLDAAREPSYDKAPREIMAGYKGIFAEVQNGCEEGLAAAKAKLEEYMDKYRPQQSEELTPES